jgi:shikimate kinase
MRIILIGAMGSGKTLVGELLAGHLGVAFLDTDRLVTEIAGKTIPALFEQEGEQGFRAWERAAVREAVASAASVIATGGGVVLDPANVALLKETGLVVWLQVSAAEAMRRCGAGKGRPLLACSLPERIATLISDRVEMYRAAADLVVDTDGRDPQEIVNEIIARLPEWGV